MSRLPSIVAKGKDSAERPEERTRPTKTSVEGYSNTQALVGTKPSTKRYFIAMRELLAGVRERDYEKARCATHVALHHLPQFVDEVAKERREFVPGVPPLKIGGTVFALMNDTEGLRRIREIAQARSELVKWVAVAHQHEEDRRLFRTIEALVRASPGVHQSRLSDEVKSRDGRRLATLVSWLEKAGKLRRIKIDKTYALFLPSASEAPSPLEQASVVSHTTGKPRSALLVDWDSVEHVALPRAPAKWMSGQLESPNPENGARFSVTPGSQWTPLREEAIPASERPDPAFRKHFLTDAGVLALDDLGKSDQHGRVVALWYRRDGSVAQRLPLEFGTYRVGVSPFGGSFVALSKDVILHAHDREGTSFLQTDLRKAPEMRRAKKRLGLEASLMHRYCRSVAINSDASRYMYTVVDEAWCVSAEGVVLWGITVPLREGYTLDDPDPSAPTTREDVAVALGVLGLSLPVSTGEVKQRFRALVRQLHPDGTPLASASEELGELHDAMTTLTGLRSDALDRYSGRTASIDLGRDNHALTTMGLSVSSQVDEADAADWFLASAFASQGGRAFVATHSGRLLELGPTGAPIRYYTLGAIPMQIVDVGDYLFVLARTRLYILQADVLVDFVDVGTGGDLMMAQTGFGILEDKRFRWFSLRGGLLAEVLSDSPIRRVYRALDDVVIETRRHRLRMAGAGPWWLEH